MTWLSAWLDTNAVWFWTVAVAVLCNVPCAILGCYLVLRRMSLLGDAISHAVLPGIAIAFLLTQSRAGWAMALGAIVLGVLTAFLTNAIARQADVPEDASMGLVFTSLFAVGVLLITRAAPQVDLDPGCVLYGSIESVPLDTFPLRGLEVPLAVRTLGPALLITVAFVVLMWKELKLVSFDPALAAAMGFRVALIHYLLMAMVAGVTVVSFEAVGSILVIAMLIVPGATAQLLTDRLERMIGWAVVVAVLSAVFGYFGAVWLDTNVAGMMAVAAGAMFGLAVLFAPRHGVLSKLIRRARLALRIAEEDILAELYRAEESPAARPSTARTWRRWAAERLLVRSGRIEPGTEGVRLTARGRAEGRELVRSHRLWEAFLSTRLELPADHVHETAHRLEHFTDAELSARIASDLANPDHDPHGRPIPPAEQDRARE